MYMCMSWKSRFCFASHFDNHLNCCYSIECTGDLYVNSQRFKSIEFKWINVHLTRRCGKNMKINSVDVTNENNFIAYQHLIPFFLFFVSSVVQHSYTRTNDTRTVVKATWNKLHWDGRWVSTPADRCSCARNSRLSFRRFFLSFHN